MDKSLFVASLAAADQVIRQVEIGQLSNETPCTEWNLHELLNHMAGELAWVPELLAGKTIAEVGDRLNGDLVDKHPHEAWSKYRHAAEVAALGMAPDAIAHVSSGDVSASYYLNEVATDIFIHTWDVARSIGAEFHIPEKIAQEIYKISRPKMNSLRKAGVVSKPLNALSGGAEARLLALYGRQP